MVSFSEPLVTVLDTLARSIITETSIDH
jgi:hypothetical protein